MSVVNLCKKRRKVVEVDSGFLADEGNRENKNEGGKGTRDTPSKASTCERELAPHLVPHSYNTVPPPSSDERYAALFHFPDEIHRQDRYRVVCVDESSSSQRNNVYMEVSSGDLISFSSVDLEAMRHPPRRK